MEINPLTWRELSRRGNFPRSRGGVISNQTTPITIISLTFIESTPPFGICIIKFNSNLNGVTYTCYITQFDFLLLNIVASHPKFESRRRPWHAYNHEIHLSLPLSFLSKALKTIFIRLSNQSASLVETQLHR